MDFSLSDVQLAWREKARTLGRDLAARPAAADVIAGAARVGLLDPKIDLLAAVVAVEALASESPSAGVVLALHSGVLLAGGVDERYATLVRGEVVAGLGLSSDEVPAATADVLTGRASWVAPLTDHGVALIGGRSSSTGDESP